MLSGEGNAGERWKTTIGIISKKATLLVQHTFFLNFYNVNTCSRSLFFHCRSLSPCIGGRQHSICPTLQNFHVILPAKKMSPLFFIPRSRSLPPFFSLSFLSFSCSILQICGHDNLSKLNTLDKTAVAMRFPTKITSSCIWVATPVDWVILHWYVCGADGRLVGQFSRMGRFTSFSYPWCSTGALRRESSAIVWENLIRIKAFCIWLSLNNYFTGQIFRGSCQTQIFINSLNEENHETILIISITLTVTLIAYAYRKWPEWIVNIYLLYHTR